MNRLARLTAVLCLLIPAVRVEPQAIHIKPAPTDPSLRNEWPAEWEEAFMQRAEHAVKQVATEGRYGNTFFENEKRSYANAMMSLLAGYEEPALKFLQEKDNPGHWSTHTEGIDFYACFTLKHQTRKYFYFGDQLKPEYKARMFRGARIWTEHEPLNRPHHAFEEKTGWGPDAKNSWVDVRNTDNLKLMRDTSVYLFAEETGNEETRLLYKNKLTTFITALYYVGQGEWDSENYLGHSIAPLLNLYDFAKDGDIKRLAKAGLDFMATSLALKYYRGNYNGPSRRDYNHPYPLGGSAAFFGYLWFGDTPIKPGDTGVGKVESDTIHVITSGYRPPAAAVELARKNFNKPAEIIAAKGRWEAWRDLGAHQPSFFETHYFGERFQFGTLARGTQHPDINGFKILVQHPKRGADTIIAGPVTDPLRLGSSQYSDELLARNSAVGQHGNFAIYLTQQSDHPYLWLIPDDAELIHQEQVTFVRMPSATLAIWPINATLPRQDDKLAERVQVLEKTNTKTGEVTKSPRWVHSEVLRSDRSGDGVYGFAIEIYDGQDPDNFMARAQQIQPETDELVIRGAVGMTSVSGNRIRLQWGNTLDAIGIWRDGQKRDWSSDSNKALFYSTRGDLISLPWQGDGQLRVNAGDETFRCQISRDGRVSFGD